MMLSISHVSRETGIAKEVLRKWEERYGFPMPVRDPAGDRLYSPEQIERLKRIKKLIDDGMRPHQVVRLDDLQLQALLSGHAATGTPPSEAARQVVGWLHGRRLALLRERLKGELHRLGLLEFVTDLMPQMNEAVGLAWAAGEINVYDEHLYTEVVQGVIREALSDIAVPADAPLVLLTTPSGELHTLGILMVEAALSVAGARCLSLGAQSPVQEITAAVRDYRVAIVGLSFSSAYSKRNIFPLLKELRGELPAEVGLWAGGAGVRGMRPQPRGVLLMDSVTEAVEALRKFSRHAFR